MILHSTVSVLSKALLCITYKFSSQNFIFFLYHVKSGSIQIHGRFFNEFHARKLLPEPLPRESLILNGFRSICLSNRYKHGNGNRYTNHVKRKMITFTLEKLRGLQLCLSIRKWASWRVVEWFHVNYSKRIKVSKWKAYSDSVEVQ